MLLGLTGARFIICNNLSFIWQHVWPIIATMRYIKNYTLWSCSNTHIAYLPLVWEWHELCTATGKRSWKYIQVSEILLDACCSTHISFHDFGYITSLRRAATWTKKESLSSSDISYDPWLRILNHSFLPVLKGCYFLFVDCMRVKAWDFLNRMIVYPNIDKIGKGIPVSKSTV